MRLFDPEQPEKWVRQFAPVAPVKVLMHLAKHNAGSSYNLFLSHNVLQNAEQFQELVKLNRTGNKQTIIVDNSVIELGHPVEAEDIRKACNILTTALGYDYRHEVVAVLPDVLLHGKKTVEVTSKAIQTFRRASIHNMMFVPQGRSYDEILTCAEVFKDIDEIRWIGVAKNFVGVLGTRWEITRVLQTIFPNAKFHMLGFSRDTRDDICCTLNHGVEGIDSSMPVRHPSPLSYTSEFAKRGDWWQEDIECTQMMVDNVKQVYSWLGQ